MKTINVLEAFQYLSKRGVTQNIQMVRRWLREGKIKAEMIDKQTGYEIDYDALVAFADAYLTVRKPKYKELIVDPMPFRTSDQLKLIATTQLDQNTKEEAEQWYLDTTYEQEQEFKHFKKLVRSLVDDATWKVICDAWDQLLKAKRDAKNETTY